jgi:predicted phage-related endonuclease
MTTFIEHRFKTETDWLKFRKTGFGGSDMTALLDMNPFKTRIDVYKNKITPFDPTHVRKLGENEQLDAGHFFEPAIANMFEAYNPAYTLTDPGEYTIYQSKEEKIFIGTPDRIFKDASEAVGPLELKNSRVQLEEARDYWIAQNNWYCGIMGGDYIVIAWAEFGSTLKYEVYDFDPELFQIQKEVALEFWHNHIIPKVPPKPVNGKEASQLYDRHLNGLMIEASEDALSQVQKLRKLRLEAKELKGKMNDIADQLKVLIGDAEGLENPNWTIEKFGDIRREILITWKNNKDRFVFNEEAFFEDHPELYRKYLERKTGSRVFRVKD